jgi:hypothetical protein
MRISVLLPQRSVIVQALPADPELIVYQTGFTMLRWVFGLIHPVSVTYSLPDEVATSADYSFWSGLLIGLGVPTAISGLVELHKESEREKHRRLRA